MGGCFGLVGFLGCALCTSGFEVDFTGRVANWGKSGWWEVRLNVLYFVVLCVVRSGVRGALWVYRRFRVEVGGMGYCFKFGWVLGLFAGS